MPKLQMNSAPCLMYRIRDPAPASDLLVRIDAGSKCITFALPGDLGCLTDNQPRTSPLPIVFSIHFIWSIAWLGGSGTGQRRHDDAIRQQQITEPERFKKNVCLRAHVPLLFLWQYSTSPARTRLASRLCHTYTPQHQYTFSGLTIRRPVTGNGNICFPGKNSPTISDSADKSTCCGP